MLGRLTTVFAKRFNVQLLQGLLLLVGLLLSVNQAHAHAALVATQPTEQAILNTPPTQVTLTFNEPVSALRMQLFAPSGTAHPLQGEAENDQIQLALPPLTEQGSYVLSWRVMSTDGHPIGGSLLFALGQPSNSLSNAINVQPSEPRDRVAAIWLTRLLIYITLFFGLGSRVFNAWQARRVQPANSAPASQQLKRPLYLGWVYLGMATTLVYLALFGLDALDLPLSGLLQLHLWQTALHSSVGVASLMMLSAFALCGYQPKSQRLARCLAALAMVLAAASLAATGHASMAPPQWLSRPAVWLHGLAVMAWLGALLPLLYSLQPPLIANDAVDDMNNDHANDAGHSPLVIFSRYIPLALIALLLSGGVLAYLQLSAWSSFISSRYGQILLAKLTLVALLLLLGAYNRYRLTAAVLRNEASARRQLRRVIYAELVLMVLVLALVALWRFTPPPRNIVMAQYPVTAAPTVIQTIKGGQLQAELTLQPNQLLIALYHADHTPLVAQAVEVRFSNPTIGMEPLHFQAHRFQAPDFQTPDSQTPNSQTPNSQTPGQADNRWLLTPLPLAPGSHWQLDIAVLVSDFERVTLQSELTLPTP